MRRERRSERFASRWVRGFPGRGRRAFCCPRGSGAAPQPSDRGTRGAHRGGPRRFGSAVGIGRKPRGCAAWVTSGPPPAQRCPLTPSGRAVGSLLPPSPLLSPPSRRFAHTLGEPRRDAADGSIHLCGAAPLCAPLPLPTAAPPHNRCSAPPLTTAGGAVEALGVPSEAPFPTRGRAVGGTELPWGRGGMEVEGGQTEVEALPYESGEALQRLPGGAVVAPSVPGGVGVGVGQPGLVVNGEVGGSACSVGGVGAPPSRRSPPTQPVLGLLIPAVFPSLPSGVGGRPVLRRSLMAFSVN